MALTVKQWRYWFKTEMSINDNNLIFAWLPNTSDEEDIKNIQEACRLLNIVCTIKKNGAGEVTRA